MRVGAFLYIFSFMLIEMIRESDEKMNDSTEKLEAIQSKLLPCIFLILVLSSFLRMQEEIILNDWHCTARQQQKNFARFKIFWLHNLLKLQSLKIKRNLEPHLHCKAFWKSVIRFWINFMIEIICDVFWTL